ncbi:MAG: SIR2 family protein [Saprospiraceae bacterium]|nr:SIR2 family protein [Saprospiraceae bacterium]
MQESRKLAIIVFADIAGYSAMMQADEVQALAVLDRFKSILEEEMQRHEGQIIQYYGDGCLLSFDSAFLSLRAAISLQSQFIKQQVPVRIGMHLGDVLYKNNNAFGDGVNIASRIESLGVPGAVLLSKTVRNQVKNKAELTLSSVGSFHFKNIAEPMEVFAVSEPGFIVPSAGQMQGKLKAVVEPEPTPQEQGDWEKYQMLEILDALEENKCVLILGNYAFSKPLATTDFSEREISVPDLLLREQHKWIGKHPADSPPDFYTSAQSLVDRAGGQRMFMDLAKIKLQELGMRQLNRFKQISEIPFDLILSTYPFDLIHEVFEENQINHQYGYYSYLQESTPLDTFTKDYPLVYNLFGSVRHKESMVITLDRLYQFIFGILGVRQLPKLIQDKVQQASHLIFLGFSFDDWYMKLLLRVLKVHEKDISYAHPSKPSGPGKQNKRFFESNFKVTFLEKKIDEFVAGLHELCKEEDLLRTGNTNNPGSQYDDLLVLAEQNRLEEVMSRLDDLLIKDGKEGGLLQELGEYQHNFHQIKEWENYNSLSKEELETKWEDLSKSLSLFIDRVAAAVPA